MRGGNDRVTRGDKIKVWVKVGGSGGDNKDGLKTCCHLDERSEEKSFVLPKRFLASLEMTQWSKVKLELGMTERGYSRLEEGMPPIYKGILDSIAHDWTSV